MTNAIFLPTNSDFLEALKEQGEVFGMETTNNSTVITHKGQKYLINDSAIMKAELGFIRSVRNHAIKNTLVFPFVKRDSINYFNVNKDIEVGIYYDVIEIDINFAYWQIAFNLGIISEEIFNKGINKDNPKNPISKKGRLMALGSMATTKNKFIFNGESFDYMGQKADDKTRNYFFTIARELDSLMVELCETMGASYFFYWFDAIFVRCDRIDYVQNFFDVRGFGCKLKNIASANVGKNKKGVSITCLEVKEEKKERTDIKFKPFFISTEQKTRANEHSEFINKIKNLV